MKKLNTLLALFLVNICIVSAQKSCTPVFSGSATFIDNFAFHTLVHIYSGVNGSGYISYLDSPYAVTVNIGKKYPITFSMPNSSGITGKYAAWIDFNNDSIFSGAELIHYDSISVYTTSGLVAIPNDTAFVGKRRLRVMTAWSPPTVKPCGNYNQGEAEDYLVNIVSNKPETRTYCMPFYPKGSDNFPIEDFSIGALENIGSGLSAKGYKLYSPVGKLTTSLSLDEEYTLFVSKASSAGSSGGYAMWIDLNNDGLFSDAEKLFSDGPNITASMGPVKIPNDTNYIGLRRLRVRSQYGSVPTDPCGLYSMGETEDYTVNITKKSELNEVQAPNFIKMFPNPSKGMVNILGSRNIDEVKVTDMLGQVVYYTQSDNSHVEFQMENEGIYFVTIRSGNATMTKKLIIAR